MEDGNSDGCADADDTEQLLMMEKDERRNPARKSELAAGGYGGARVV